MHPDQPRGEVPVVIDVHGIPASQGSKTRMPNGALVEGSSTKARTSLAEWRRAVSDAARVELARGLAPFEGPVHLSVEFRFPSTKSDPHRHFHRSYPDLSKILRSTEDALTQSGLIHDDRLISEANLTKRYTRAGESPGAQIHVQSLEPLEAHRRAQRKALAVEARSAK